MKNSSLLALIHILFLIIVSGCAHLQEPVSAEVRGGAVAMTASDFKFEPNNLTTRVGDTIDLKIHNLTGSGHNFTLKDPDGIIVQSIDIPPRGSVDVKTTFSKAGTYKFYCNKTGHSELGMKGQVVTTQR